MIDIHCHILPELDDGPGSLADALSMARMAAGDGIQTLVASSHITPGVYDNTPEGIVSAVRSFEARLQEEGIPVKVIPGSDVRIFPEMVSRPESFLRINENSPYFLFEFPHALIPPGSEGLAESLLNNNLVPVITHPERNGGFLRDPGRLGIFVKLGCLVQVTAMSLTGGFGSEVSRLTERFMKEGLVHVIATDAHDTVRRPPVLSTGFKKAEEWVGKKEAEKMVQGTPEKIVKSVSGE